MIGRVTVASVMSIFTKLIEKLEKIQERQQVIIDAKTLKVERLKTEMSLATTEQQAAATAIKKLRGFTDGDEG